MSVIFDEYDELSLYFGDDYKINEKIIIHQPTIGEIIEYGEQKYFSMVSTLCSIPSDLKSFLWDNGIDWEKISDFDYFCLICTGFKKSETNILFGDIDFSGMKKYVDKTNDEIVLADIPNKVRIDRLIYQKMIDYIRYMHNIVPKVEHAQNEHTKKFLIDLDRQDKARLKESKPKSVLKPLISSMLNIPGFKYKKSELREVGIVEFMDSVQRVQIIMSTNALMNGVYSGMVDTKKINKEEFNFMREIKRETQRKGVGIEVNK